MSIIEEEVTPTLPNMQKRTEYFVSIGSSFRVVEHYFT